MDIKSLVELQQPDDRFSYFAPAGATAAQAAEYHQQMFAHLDLHPDVPETLRASFERARATYTLGVLNYDSYTLAHDQARMLLEQALRERFFAEYPAGAVFSDASGNRRIVAVGTVSELFDQIRTLHRSGSGWKLQLPRSGGEMRFPGMLSSLLQWARAEGLLFGQRNRHVEKLMAKMRNHVAHAAGYHLVMPGDAARAIADATEIINRLWGRSTPDGRMYPAPARRDVAVVAWDTQGMVLGGTPEGFPPPFVDVDNLTCVVVLADPGDDLMGFDAQYETTRSPCDLLWGPGTWPDAASWLAAEQPASDEVEVLDRMFLVRFHDQRVYLPRRTDVAAALEAGERTGQWLLLQTDHPNDAFGHARQQLAGGYGCAASGPCPRCAVMTWRRGDWGDILSYLASTGTTINPVPSPDVRTPSVTASPRWNEITGKGSWSVPSM